MGVMMVVKMVVVVIYSMVVIIVLVGIGEMIIDTMTIVVVWIVKLYYI